MKPVVDGLRRAYEGRIEFKVYSAIESDSEASRFASRQGVRAVPTMMLVAPDGAELYRREGFAPTDELQVEFERALSTP